MKKIVLVTLLAATFLVSEKCFSLDSNKDLTLNDGTDDSPSVILKDSHSEYMQLQKKDRGESSVYSSHGPITLRPSGNDKSYLSAETSNGTLVLWFHNEDSTGTGLRLNGISGKLEYFEENMDSWREIGSASSQGSSVELEQAIESLESVIATKADQSLVVDLSATVAGKASQTSLDTLTATVGGKANQSSLDTLSTTVGTLTTTVNAKAEQSDLTALSASIASKATQASVDTLTTNLSSLTTTVGGKANQSSLDTLITTVGTLTTTVNAKAEQSDLTALSASIASKATQASVDTLTTNLSSLTTTVGGKANQSSLDTLSTTVGALTTTVNAKAEQSDLTALSASVASKATQASVDTLTTNLSNLTTTVSGKANQSSLDTLSTTVGTLTTTVNAKAEQSDLTALSASVASKATQASVDTLTTNLGNLTTAVSGKADQSSLDTLSTTVDTLTTTVNAKAELSDLTALSASVSSKATQASVDTLTTNLSNLTSTVSGKANQSSLDTLSTTLGTLSTTVNAKAEQSDLTALTSTVSTKASQSSVDTLSSNLSSLSTSVAGKASQASLDTVTTSVNTLETAVASKADSSTVSTLSTAILAKANSWTLASKSADFTVQTSDRETFFVINNTSVLTVSLPDASSAASTFMIALRRAGPDYDVIISPHGTDKIDGKEKLRLKSANASVTLICDGAQWYIFNVSGYYTEYNLSGACPAGYVTVPGNVSYATENFCIAKYEMKGGTSSVAAGTPTVSINQTTAKSSCTSLGTGYHLITENEWMTVARNIENVGANWSGNNVGSGALNRGHTDSVPLNSLAANTDDTAACDGTGQSCSNTVWNDQRRTHFLSTGEVIWDFAGNVWEWVDWNIATNDKASAQGAWIEVSAAVPTSSMPKASFYPENEVFNSTQNIGRYYPGASGGGGAAFRGAGWSHGTNAGIYALYLAAPSTNTAADLGFRCVWTPGG